MPSLRRLKSSQVTPRLCGLGRRGRRGEFYFSVVRFPRIIKCGRMLMTRKSRRRLLRRSPHIHAQYLAKRTAQTRETRARSWVCCFELLYVSPSAVPFPHSPNPTALYPESTYPTQLHQACAILDHLISTGNTPTTSAS